MTFPWNLCQHFLETKICNHHILGASERDYTSNCGIRSEGRFLYIRWWWDRSNRKINVIWIDEAWSEVQLWALGYFWNKKFKWSTIHEIRDSWRLQKSYSSHKWSYNRQMDTRKTKWTWVPSHVYVQYRINIMHKMQLKLLFPFLSWAKQPFKKGKYMLLWVDISLFIGRYQSLAQYVGIPY